MAIPRRFIIIDRSLPRLLEDAAHPSGGAAVQLMSWLDGLLKLDIEISVVCDSYPENVPHQFKEIRFLPIKNSRTISKVSSLRYIKALYYLLEEPKSVVYQTGAGYLTFIVALICKKYDHFFLHRIANDADTDERIRFKLNGWNSFLYKNGVRLADLLLCQNSYQLKQIEKKYTGILSKKIPNPYLNLHADPVIHSFSERNYYAWVGIFQYQKNISLLKDLAGATPEYQYHIAGKPATNIDDESVEALNDLKDMDNVVFRGFLNRAELIKFLSKAKGLVNTSHYEGFSNTFLEAFSAGTPLITNVRANPDKIVNRYSLGYSAETVDEYIYGIRQLNDEKNFNQFSENCIQYLNDHHNNVSLSEKLISILDDVRRT